MHRRAETKFKPTGIQNDCYDIYYLIDFMYIPNVSI